MNYTNIATYGQKMRYLFLIKTQTKQNTKSRDELLCHLQTFLLILADPWSLFQAHPHILSMDHWPQACRHLTWLPFASCISLKLHSLIKDPHIMNVRIHSSMTLEVSDIPSEHGRLRVYVLSLAFRSLHQLLSWPLMATTLYSSGSLLGLQCPAQATPLSREPAL